MQVNELFGKYALGTIRAEDYIAWAEQQLVAGVNAPTLPVLAGMDLNRPIDSIEVYECFCSVTNELGIDWPAGPDALRTYSKILCRQLLAGELAPDIGLSQLARLYAASDYSGRLYALWDELEEDISLLYTEHGPVFNSGLTREDSAEYIRNVARQYLQLVELKLPDNFNQLAYCDDCHQIEQIRMARIDKPWLPQWLYRLLYHKGPTWEWRCGSCASRNLYPMNDYTGREKYLDTINKKTRT